MAASGGGSASLRDAARGAWAAYRRHFPAFLVFGSCLAGFSLAYAGLKRPYSDPFEFWAWALIDLLKAPVLAGTVLACCEAMRSRDPAKTRLLLLGPRTLRIFALELAYLAVMGALTNLLSPTFFSQLHIYSSNHALQSSVNLALTLTYLALALAVTLLMIRFWLFYDVAQNRVMRGQARPWRSAWALTSGRKMGFFLIKLTVLAPMAVGLMIKLPDGQRLFYHFGFRLLLGQFDILTTLIQAGFIDALIPETNP